MTTPIRSFAYVVAGAELLSKGVDFSTFSYSEFKGRAEFSSGTVFKIQIDDATKNMFHLQSNYIVREGSICSSCNDKNFEPNLTLDIDKVKQIMQCLYEANIECFSDFDEGVFIDNYDEYIKDLDASFNKSLEMHKKLSRENTDDALKIFLALFNYRNDYSKKLYEENKKDREFLLTPTTDDFEIIDNRMYIYFKPSDINKLKKILAKCDVSYDKNLLESAKAFVISKNVYDYFWASYGNSFQSCFSLNSDYNYLYGYVPFAVTPESFMCYVTNGDVNKIPVISGKQFLCPNMLFRCWGYADEEKVLLLDKRYASIDGRIVDAFIDILKNKIKLYNDINNSVLRDLYNKGRGIHKVIADVNGSLYADSLKRNGLEVCFQYNNGDHSFGFITAPWSSTHSRFLSYASTIVSVSDKLTLDKPFAVVNGVLLNPKICPVTGFTIEESMTESPFAKFFTKPCKKACMLTYINGCVFCDISSEEYDGDHFKISSKGSSRNKRNFIRSKLYAYNYSSNVDEDYKGISLKTLKEHLKGYIKDTNFDGILLRYFEGNEVKYQFYKKG